MGGPNAIVFRPFLSGIGSIFWTEMDCYLFWCEIGYRFLLFLAAKGRFKSKIGYKHPSILV